jgi:hypothetical protein
MRADTVKTERMVSQFEVHFGGNLGLAMFNDFVLEFFDVATLDANEVVMMIASVEFEDRVATLKMVSDDETGCFKLRQNPIDGRKPNLFTIGDEGLENFFRAQMLALSPTPFKDVKNLDSG